MKVIDKIALVLIIIGAINWGLIGFFQFNLVDTIFGQMSVLSRIISTPFSKRKSAKASCSLFCFV